MNYQSPPEAEFSSLSSQIRGDIEQLSKNVYRMERMVNQPGNQAELHKLQRSTNILAREINNLFKALSHLAQPVNPSEQRARRLMRDRLTNDFSEALRNFQVVQRTAANRVRTHSPSGVDEDVEAARQAGNLIQLSAPQQQQQLQQLQQEEDVDLDVLREREQQIRRIESDIVEVNQIFKDLATMVHEQGDTVDSIESNIVRATIQVSDGAQQIARARDYQNRARRKTCFLAMIFFAIMFIIILITYFSS